MCRYRNVNINDFIDKNPLQSDIEFEETQQHFERLATNNTINVHDILFPVNQLQLTNIENFDLARIFIEYFTVIDTRNQIDNWRDSIFETEINNLYNINSCDCYYFEFFNFCPCESEFNNLDFLFSIRHNLPTIDLTNFYLLCLELKLNELD